MSFCFRKARPGEPALVYELITDRVRWMDENDIHQWNDTNYLEVFPLEYYEACLERMYVLVEEASGRILSAGVLLEDKDQRWDSDAPAYYVHNLVSVRNSGGAGKEFLRCVEELAVRNGKQYLRLDSSDDNPKLTAYYEALGFVACGSCQVGQYHGNLRQKVLKG